MHTKRVLLAHRDSDVRELASRALASIGVTLDVATDAGEALLHIARKPYTVIAAEADVALIAAIAQRYVDRRPVVIVTAPETTTAPLDADVVSMVVAEPVDPKTLVGVILACVTPIPPADFGLGATSGKDLK